MCLSNNSNKYESFYFYVNNTFGMVIVFLTTKLCGENVAVFYIRQISVSL